MPLVFLSKRLKGEEQNKAKLILKKYSDNIEYTDIPNDSNLDLSIRTQSDILTNLKYKTLTVTFSCLMQMDSKGIDPFLFQPRNIGLRNLFLLGMKISLFEINFVKPIVSLVTSMGGTIDDSDDPNNADIVITDKKYKTHDFSIPLVSTDWIYAISNQTTEVPYDDFIVFKEPIVKKKHIKCSSQLPEMPKIVKEYPKQSISQITPIPEMNVEFKNENKKENASASKINIMSQKSKSRRRNIINCIRPANRCLSNNANIMNSFESVHDCMPCPSFDDFQAEEDSQIIVRSPIKENSIIKISQFHEKIGNDFNGNSNFGFNNEEKEKPKVCSDFPLPGTPEQTTTCSPKIKTSPLSNHIVSPKLKEIMTIIQKKSNKQHKKANNNSIRSFPSIEELNDFSQIPQDENDDEIVNDVYYDKTKEIKILGEQHSTQVDEEELFDML